MALVCLDVDGCLVDSREMIVGSFQRAMARLGLAPLDAEVVATFIGPPLQETARRVVADADGVLPEQLVDAYRDDFSRTCLDHVRTYPGVPEAVATLAERHTLAVVTSKPIPFARPLLDALDLSRHFALMEGPDLAEQEAKVDTLARALARAEVPPGPHAVMVGDRHHDIAAGRAHGLRTVAVGWGFGDADEHVAAGADALVAAPADLPTTIDEVLAA